MEQQAPEYIEQRKHKARVRTQLASLQYILGNANRPQWALPGPANTDTLESYIRSLYPFPQDLEEEAIRIVMDDADLMKKVVPAFERTKLYADQRKLFMQIKLAIISQRREAAQPDPKALDTLGWRGWKWDPDVKLLRSPAYDAFWEGAELRVENWDTSDAVRNCRGIHAKLIPCDWKAALWQGEDHPELGDYPVTGIVERFGRYVLGTLGWRAEWVIIRKLLAPTQAIGFELEKAYPDVEVCYFDIQKYGEF